MRTVGGGPDSEALVVLYGGPGLSHDYLTGLSALAAPRLRVVFYDQRGVGRSTGTVDADLPARLPDTLHHHDGAGALPGISMPTLLVYGDKDVRAPLTVANHLHAAISGSTLVVLPDTGHVCNIESPEAFNRAVRTFLLDIQC